MDNKYEQLEKLGKQLEKGLITKEEFENEKRKILLGSNKKEDTYSYKGWLISDSFIKRALAVAGYNFIGGIIIYIVILVFIVFIGLIIGLFSSIK